MKKEKITYTAPQVIEVSVKLEHQVLADSNDLGYINNMDVSDNIVGDDSDEWE